MSAIDSKTAATILGKSPETVTDWARRGIIPAVKFGKNWLFYADQLEEFARAKAQENVRCRSTADQAHDVFGVVSRSAVARFASAQAPRTGRKPRNSRQPFALVTGGKQS